MSGNTRVSGNIITEELKDTVISMKKKAILNLTLSALLTAIGLVLPFLTGQIPQFGRMLLPMHLPVFLCGLICGWQYGLAVGFILPLLRSLIFIMPPIYPEAVAMAFELATYGLVAGLLYGLTRRKSLLTLLDSMTAAMLAGRLVWGAAEVILLGLGGKAFTWKLFFAGAFINAFPGIIIQFILIPAVMVVLDRTGLVRFGHRDTTE